MYKVLIVDDERMIRMGIEKSIAWNKLKIDKVFTAASAKEAVAVMEREHPDIMITDISMAEMSGLELARRVLDDGKKLRVIILTGYDRFDYAREVLQIHVHDFLLKPIDEDQLTESIRAQVEALDELEKQDAKVRSSRAKGVISQSFLESVLCDYLHGRHVDEQREERFFREFQFPRDMGVRIGLLIFGRENREDSEEARLARQTVREICMSLLDEPNRGITFECGEGRVALLFFSGVPDEAGMEQDVSEMARLLLDVLETEMEVKPRLVFGSEVQGFRNLQVSFNDAMRTLESERGTITDILYNQTESSRNDIFNEVFREFRQAMVRNVMNLGEVMHIFERFKMAVLSYNLGRKYTVSCCFDLASAIYFTYCDETGNVPDESLNALSRSLVGADRETAEQITEMFLQKLLGRDDGDEHELVRRVKRVVHEELAGDLTVASLAARMYVSPNYLSRLFKRITGEGCNEYIVRKRIEKARSLLATTSIRIGEIAELVGYHDINYFSLAFKKHTGQSPSKYRSMMQK